MTKEELIEHISNEHGFMWCEDGDIVHVRWNKAPEGESLKVNVNDLKDDVTWANIRKMAKNGRDVEHFTRIVGYYSKTKDWNPSKLAERKDRHNGNYSV